MLKSKLLSRIADAVEVEPEVHSIDSSVEVMDYVRHRREEIYVSDKEVPETFRDIRTGEDTVGGEIDPGYFLLPNTLTGSQLDNDAAAVSNYRVFIKRYADVEGVFPITGDKGSFGIALRISAISHAILDDLKILDERPEADKDDAAQVEHKVIDEAWGDWVRYDFIRAIEDRSPDHAELIDSLDEDQSRELFDRVRRRLGIEWVEGSAGPFIDVEQIAGDVSPKDLSAPEPKLLESKEANVLARAPGVSFKNLLTKEQVLWVYEFAGMSLDKLPTKSGQTVMLPVPEEGVDIRITRSDKKSTYDKPLWMCEHVRRQPELSQR